MGSVLRAAGSWDLSLKKDNFLFLFFSWEERVEKNVFWGRVMDGWQKLRSLLKIRGIHIQSGFPGCAWMHVLF